MQFFPAAMSGRQQNVRMPEASGAAESKSGFSSVLSSQLGKSVRPESVPAAGVVDSGPVRGVQPAPTAARAVSRVSTSSSNTSVTGVAPSTTGAVTPTSGVGKNMHPATSDSSPSPAQGSPRTVARRENSADTASGFSSGRTVESAPRASTAENETASADARATNDDRTQSLDSFAVGQTANVNLGEGMLAALLTVQHQGSGECAASVRPSTAGRADVFALNEAVLASVHQAQRQTVDRFASRPHATSTGSQEKGVPTTNAAVGVRSASSQQSAPSTRQEKASAPMTNSDAGVRVASGPQSAPSAGREKTSAPATNLDAGVRTASGPQSSPSAGREKTSAPASNSELEDSGQECTLAEGLEVAPKTVSSGGTDAPSRPIFGTGVTARAHKEGPEAAERLDTAEDLRTVGTTFRVVEGARDVDAARVDGGPNFKRVFAPESTVHVQEGSKDGIVTVAEQKEALESAGNEKVGAQAATGSTARSANGATAMAHPDGFSQQRGQGDGAKHGAHFVAGQEKQGDQLGVTGADGQAFSVNGDVLAQGGRSGTEFVTAKGPDSASLARGAEVYKQVESGAFTNLSQGGKQLVIRLDPPELGQVSVVLRVRGKDVQAVLRATNPEATQALNEQLGQLRGSLEAQGLRVGKLEVQTPLPDAQADAQWQGTEQHNESQKNRESAMSAQRFRFSARSEEEILVQDVHDLPYREKNARDGVDIFA